MNDVWLIGGQIFDATGRAPYRADLRISNGRIADIVEHDDVVDTSGTTHTANAPVTRYDITGCTVLPGLIDAHAHVGILRLSGQNEVPAPVQAAQVFANLATSLEQGFTTLRDLGGVDGGLVAAVEEGYIPGPRLLPSGRILSQTAGHGDLRRRFSSQCCNPGTGAEGIALPMHIVDGVSEALRAARDQFRRGATQIKVFASGGVLSEGDPLESPQFSEEELRAIVSVAEDRDSYVTAHAHTVRGIQRGIRAGVTCFEHGTILDEETVHMLAASGAVVVGTQTVAEIMRVAPESLGIPEAWLEDAARVREKMAESLTMLYEAGVPVGAGADLVGTDQTQRGWEIALRADIVDAQRAIESSTRVNAEILGIADDVGTVEGGKIADLVVVDFDPVQRVHLFKEQRPHLVFQAGDLVSRDGTLVTA
ncbi:metal-dependent hydrolase family protein [Nesterenkonia alba]|uniref:metal-dependent hydrolase family protein n=1 Tax=Nesterenkonia alba TaxID=515814 RepID=UPI0003B4B401|nr:amidohydrolase family protein [Nesterenkonia alba]